VEVDIEGDGETEDVGGNNKIIIIIIIIIIQIITRVVVEVDVNIHYYR
jgi:hypothetical protein